MRASRTKRARRALGAFLLAGLVLLVAGCRDGSDDRISAVTAPRSAAAFVDSIGVNVHMSYLDTPYRDVGRIAGLLDQLGVRHVRDGLVEGVLAQRRALERLGAAGVRSTLIAGDPQARFGTLEQLLAQVRGELRRATEALEGANEFDLRGGPGWPEALRAHQRQLFAAANLQPRLRQLPVLAPSLGRTASRPLLGDISAWSELGNLHSYPAGEPPEANLVRELEAAEITSATEPVQTTETGYHNALAATSGQPPVSERAAAVYVPRLVAEYFRRGIQRTFLYELHDEFADPGLTDPEANFGLVRHDGSPKPAFRALARLIALAGDGAEAPLRPLRVSLEGQVDRVRQLLLQRRDGSYLLLLWQDVSVWETATRRDRSPADLRVSLGVDRAMDRWAVFRPSRRSEAVRRGRGMLRTVDVGADISVVELRPAKSG